ncbi:hypothetical protein LEP1GSC170_3383 [Leptospira interrogans serovar Bataviae str. HAI135]|nr:hypothetical protein LEP1GSC170_3383 [Leptospira interrogans serovar Bataviae str. HAI135]
MKFASDSPRFSYVELTLIISKILDYKILLVLKDLFIKKPKI